jgi:hypothetical protein
VSAFLWPLNDFWAWDQPGTVVVDTTVEGAFLVSFRSFGVGSACHYVGRYDSLGRLCVLCSFGERGHSHPLWWLAQLFRALLWPLFDRSAWATLWLWARQLRALLRNLLVCSAWSKPLSWLALQVRALIWHLFVRSAWDQTATVVAGTTLEGDVLAAVRSVGVGSASHCVCRHVW